jgi:glutathione S-transferase
MNILFFFRPNLVRLGAVVAAISDAIARQFGSGRNVANVYSRCAIRIHHLLDWFEDQVVNLENGFVPDVISPQDVFLTCWCQFIELRPLRLSWRAPHRPKIAALIKRMEKRRSIQKEPALWWGPGVTYATPTEVEWAKSKTIYHGLSYADWSRSKA